MMSENINPSRQDKQVALWLIIVAVVIFGMIMLGGVTRLTNSGLSIVDWNPIMGVVPPLTQDDWQQTFEQYKLFPEYQKVNRGMALEEFKRIFYFEYLHRLLGRLIGLLFLLPFLFFWWKGAIRKPMLPSMVILFILGGLQGVLGWYMVKSGLVDNPRVSQYRLTAHLMAAILIYSSILWVAFGLLKKRDERLVNDTSFGVYKYALALSYLIAFMIMTGGFVAGTRAGLAYNTFPLMAGQFIPDNLYIMQPFWINWFENLTTIQFNHRMIAYLLIVLIPMFCFALRRVSASPRINLASHLFLAMLLIQVTLGVCTILFSVPVAVASLHQGGAVLLLTLSLYITRELKPEFSLKNG